MDVYPFQRVQEASFKNTNRRKKEKNSRQKFEAKKIVSKAQSYVQNFGAQIISYDNLFLVVGALILSRAIILAELLPFLFAFVAGLGHRSKPKLIIVVAAAMIGTIINHSAFMMWSNLLTILMLGIVLYWHRTPPNRIIWGIPVLTGATIFSVKTILLFSLGFTLYGLMVIIFEAIISGILSFIMLTIEESWQEKKQMQDYTFEDQASIVILGIGLIIGLMNVNFFGLSCGGILCRMIILGAAFIWGSGGGTVVGVGAGFIPSLSTAVLAESIGMFGISGLLAGLFRSFGSIGSIVGFILGVLGFSLFQNDSQLIIYGLWETGIAALLFYLILHFWGHKIVFVRGESIHYLSANAALEKPVKADDGAMIARVQGLADVFEELSSTFSHSSSPNNQPNSSYLDFLYESVNQDFCQKCTRFDRCWGRDAHVLSREIMDLFAIAETEGELLFDDCSREFKKICIRAKDMVREINRNFETLRINHYWAERYARSQELVSKQLQGLGKVIRQLTEEIPDNPTLNHEIKASIIAGLIRMGIKGTDVQIERDSNQRAIITLRIEGCSQTNNCVDNIAPALSNLWGEPLTVSAKKCTATRRAKSCQVVLTGKPNYKIDYGTAQVSKESVCGDSFAITTLPQSKELIALSDGMGVGENACGDSQVAISLLEKLLSNGFDKQVALETVNSVLMLRSTRESFATLDMVMVDLHSAEADIIKIGSAPTFIKTASQIETIVSNTLPIGILNSIDMVAKKRQLAPGSMIILVSDGVLELSRTKSRDIWIPDFMNYLNEKNPQTVAEMIINRALAECKGRPEDDMTVICVTIELAD